MASQKTVRSQEALVKEHFEKHALDWQSVYGAHDLDSFNIQLRKAYVLGYIDELDLKPKSTVLDHGCGTGHTVVDLTDRGFKVIGIDISENMIELARQNCQEAGIEAELKIGDVERIELPDDCCDAVIAMGLIEYLKYDYWALREMHRVLKVGGYLLVTVPNLVRLSYILDPFYVLSLIKQFSIKLISRYVLRGPKTGGSATTRFKRKLHVPPLFRLMLRKIGYEVVDSVTHGYGPFGVLKRFKGLSLKLNWLLHQLKDRRIFPFLADLGNNCVVLCRKKARSAGVSQRRIKGFLRENRGSFGRLEAWKRAHSQYDYRNTQDLTTVIDSGGNVLVISPHPDDEIIGCGGTIIKLIASGVEVSVVHLTDGSDTSALRESPAEIRRTVRLQEAQTVSAELGLHELILWKERDRELRCSEENIGKMRDMLLKIRPSAIFVPFVNDAHPDHIAANAILAASLAAEELQDFETDVLGYEVWSYLPANCYCNIDEQFDAKARMLLRYRTGMKMVDYVRYCESLNSYHAEKLTGRKGFVEAFFRLPADGYRDLVARPSG